MSENPPCTMYISKCNTLSIMKRVYFYDDHERDEGMKTQGYYCTYKLLGHDSHEQFEMLAANRLQTAELFKYLTKYR